LSRDDAIAFAVNHPGPLTYTLSVQLYKLSQMHGIDMIDLYETNPSRRNTTPAKIEITAHESKMNTQLAQLGLTMRTIDNDGNCGFRAIADQIDGSDARHLEHRRETIRFMRREHLRSTDRHQHRG